MTDRGKDYFIRTKEAAGCTSKARSMPGGPLDGVKITKQNSPNKITADNESVTELCDDVRVLISIPQRVLSQFHKCPSSSLNPKGKEGPFYLDVSKLIMCFIPVRPWDRCYCNIPSCWGRGRILIFFLVR